MQTIAQAIAADFPDGHPFDNAAGESIAETAGQCATFFEHNGDPQVFDTVTRCIFSDGSALLVGAVWDVETFRQPWESDGAEWINWDTEWERRNNNGEGYAVGDDGSDINELTDALDAVLIRPAGTDGDTAVYRCADGTVVLVGDAHGPWAVTLL